MFCVYIASRSDIKRKPQNINFFGVVFFFASFPCPFLCNSSVEMLRVLLKKLDSGSLTNGADDDLLAEAGTGEKLMT